MGLRPRSVYLTEIRIERKGSMARTISGDSGLCDARMFCINDIYYIQEGPTGYRIHGLGHKQ